MKTNELKDQVDTLMKYLLNDAGIRCSSDYAMIGFDGKAACPHIVIKAPINREKPQNFISLCFNDREVRIFIPYVATKEEFKKKYGFPLKGIVPQGYGSTSKQVWAIIDQTHFTPLFTNKGDSTLIRNFLKSLNPKVPTAQQMTNQEQEALGDNITLDDPLTASTEGKLNIQYRVHRQRERDPEIVRLKKLSVLKDDPQLRCEACSISMKEVYGNIGNNFCEVHHRTPLWRLSEDETVRTTLDDLAVLCPNCHAIIHRDRGNPLTVERLKEIILGRKSKL